MHQVHTLNPAYAHRPHALCRGRPCCGRVVGLCPAVSWLVADPIVADHARPWLAPRPASSALCHDTNCCIVTQCKLKMGSSPAAFLHLFFSISFLLHFSSSIGRPKKKKIYFLFSINLLKFISFIFFSSFTHCKTLEKFLLIINFFPMCYSLSTQSHNSYNT